MQSYSHNETLDTCKLKIQWVRWATALPAAVVRGILVRQLSFLRQRKRSMRIGQMMTLRRIAQGKSQSWRMGSHYSRRESPTRQRRWREIAATRASTIEWIILTLEILRFCWIFDKSHLWDVVSYIKIFFNEIFINFEMHSFIWSSHHSQLSNLWNYFCSNKRIIFHFTYSPYFSAMNWLFREILVHPETINSYAYNVCFFFIRWFRGYSSEFIYCNDPNYNQYSFNLYISLFSYVSLKKTTLFDFWSPHYALFFNFLHVGTKQNAVKSENKL